MKSSFAKPAAAAAIIAATVLGISVFVDTGNTSGVVWAEVIQNVQTSRGVVYRNRSAREGRADMSDYSMVYLTPSHSRSDAYKGDKIIHSSFCDFDTRTVAWVAHDARRFTRGVMSEQTLREQHGAWSNPGMWVQEFLSRDYSKLGQRTADGVLCEGLRTTDPAFGVATFQVDSVVASIWVSVKTRYPVLLEADIVGDNGQLHITGILDQFQWDVELDESMFEPNIPADYTPMETLQP